MSKLSKLSTRAPKDLDKEAIKKQTAGLLDQLDELQNLLYAEGKHSLLVIIQGMDASGKDGAIKNVFSAINPLGISVQSFKAPTELEKSHDFLWRIHQHAPAKGMIQLFNRSHYEDVLITRVHGWCDEETAKKRFRAINQFERLLTEGNGTVILKFYLHISPQGQQERLKERMEDPAKGWKYKAADFEEAKHWDDYMKMYGDVFAHCNDIPWTLVPADQNWYKEYLIALTTVKALKALNMRFPKIERPPDA